MACERLELAHAPGTEPLSQVVDERGAALPVGGIGDDGRVELRRFHALGRRDGEPERLEAEAELDRLGDALKLEIDEACDVLDIAGWQCQPELERRNLAVD